jgi:hypothetical protein
VYVVVALREILKTANHLYTLLGDNPIQRPDLGNWSMVEVARVVEWNSSSPYPTGSLRGLLSYVGHMSQARDSFAWPGYADYPSIRGVGVDKLPTSFRGIIEYWPDESEMVQRVATGI